MNLPAFDGNDYRKRVLAAVDKRGGLERSDPFEVYDLPLELAGALPDEAVTARLDEVWAFWQKQRDHPKYRGLVTALLAAHPHLAEQLRSPVGRRLLAEDVRLARARRDEEQYRELDAALDRLVERFGQIPDDKVEGLRRFARDHGLDDTAFQQRLALRRRPSSAADSPAGASRRDDRVLLAQVRSGLDELGQLDGVHVPSLHALLDLPPTADREAVRHRRDVLSALNRERRPDRRRALVDDLLVAVGRLLIEGDADAYLDHLREGVREQLRPRVAAAVLVEDDLTPDDAAYLVQEAVAAGLDARRAAALVNELAAELGIVGAPAQLPPTAARPPDGRRTHQQQSGAAAWTDRVTRGRVALRAGMLREARSHLVAALDAADGMYPPIRALQDDVAAAEAQAADAWRQAEEALAERRYTAAAVVLEVLVGVARDTHGPQGDAPEDLLARARAEVVRADDRCRAADGLRGDDRELALLAVLDAVADHEVARRELTAVGVAPATEVVVAHVPGGRRIAWRPSLSPGPVDYRVLRVAPDGSRRMVGRTRSTSLEDGARDEVAGYVVIASRAGISAPEAIGSTTAGTMPAGPRPPREAPFPPAPVPGVPAVESLTVAPHGRRIRLVFPPPPVEVTAEVRRLPVGALPPPAGSVVDPDELGTPVPAMAPGLAVDGRPSATVTHYVVLSRSATTAVAGASAAFVAAPPATGAELAAGKLRWTWPAGCTEAVVVFGRSEPPSGPADPDTVSRRITNARYEIDGGVTVPDGHQHAAVFTCLRVDGRLHVSSEAPPGARAQLA